MQGDFAGGVKPGDEFGATCGGHVVTKPFDHPRAFRRAVGTATVALGAVVAVVGTSPPTGRTVKRADLLDVRLRSHPIEPNRMVRAG